MKISISSKMSTEKANSGGGENKNKVRKKVEKRKERCEEKTEFYTALATKKISHISDLSRYSWFSRVEKPKFERQSNPTFQSHFFYPNSSCLCERFVRTESSFLGLDVFAFNAYKEFEVFKSLHLFGAGTTTYDNWPRTRLTLKRAILGRHPCARTGLTRLARPVHNLSETEELIPVNRERSTPAQFADL